VAQGNDLFQIGQIFGLKRDQAEGLLLASDVFPSLVPTTRGWLSPGISAPMVVHGGSGDDQFTVYSNQAELRLEGDDDNDSFEVRAFALAAVVDTDANGDGLLDVNDILNPTIDTNGDGVINAADARLSDDWRDWVLVTDPDGVAVPLIGLGTSVARPVDIRTGAGENQVQYHLNAPVSVDGGTGFNKLAILGTEFADAFVITDRGIFGAGAGVRFTNIQVVEIDGLEGDDQFFVQSTAFGTAYRLVGGLGSDVFNVAGDVTTGIVTRELEGVSGTVNHRTMSDDPRYKGLVVDGFNYNVASAEEGAVVITESGGFTSVTEGGGRTAVDNYFVRLARQPQPGQKVYVTVSAARSPQEEADDTLANPASLQDGPGDTIWISTTAPADPNDPLAADFQRFVWINGVLTPVASRAVVLVFDHTDWDTDQEVFVFAVDDDRSEGDRVVVIQHSVISADPAFDAAGVANVEVLVRDNDTPGVRVTQIQPGSYNSGTGQFIEDDRTLVIEGDTITGLRDELLVQLATGKGIGVGEQVVVKLNMDADSDQRIELFNPLNDLRFDHIARTITFTAADWNIPVLVRIGARDDSREQDPFTAVLRFDRDASTTAADYLFPNLRSGRGLIPIEVIDNDTPGAVVLESDGSTLLIKDDPTGTDEYFVRLTLQPEQNTQLAVLTDGLADVVSILSDGGLTWIGPADLQEIGSVGQGLFEGQVHVEIDGAARRLVRTDLSGWLAAGFLEGQRVRVTALDASGVPIAGQTADFKIAIIRGENETFDEKIEFTAEGTLPAWLTGTVNVRVSRTAAMLTFTGTDWYEFQTVTLQADPLFEVPLVRQGVRFFPVQSHLLSRLRGPVAIEGGVTGADRSLKLGLKLPGEADGFPLQIGAQPPESQQIDVLNIFNDSSQQAHAGQMTQIGLTGFGMAAGIDFSDLLGMTSGRTFGEPVFFPGGISWGKINFGGGGFGTDANETHHRDRQLDAGPRQRFARYPRHAEPGAADLGAPVLRLHPRRPGRRDDRAPRLRLEGFRIPNRPDGDRRRRGRQLPVVAIEDFEQIISGVPVVNPNDNSILVLQRISGQALPPLQNALRTVLGIEKEVSTSGQFAVRHSVSVNGNLVFANPLPAELPSGISGRITGTTIVNGVPVGIDWREAGFLRGQTVAIEGISGTFQVVAILPIRNSDNPAEILQPNGILVLGGGPLLSATSGPLTISATVPGMTVTRSDAQGSWHDDGFLVGHLVQLAIGDVAAGTLVETQWRLLDIFNGGRSVTLKQLDDALLPETASVSATLSVNGPHGGLTTVHGGGNSLLQITGSMDAANHVALPDGGVGSSLTRRDGLAWQQDGFAIGDRVQISGVVGTRVIVGFADADPSLFDNGFADQGLGSVMLLSGAVIGSGTQLDLTVHVAKPLRTEATGVMDLGTRFRGNRFPDDGPVDPVAAALMGETGTNFLTRYQGSWITDGFYVGQHVWISEIPGTFRGDRAERFDPGGGHAVGGAYLGVRRSPNAAFGCRTDRIRLQSGSGRRGAGRRRFDPRGTGGHRHVRFRGGSDHAARRAQLAAAGLRRGVVGIGARRGGQFPDRGIRRFVVRLGDGAVVGPGRCVHPATWRADDGGAGRYRGAELSAGDLWRHVRGRGVVQRRSGQHFESRLWA
jgi:hypothetical protein